MITHARIESQHLAGNLLGDPSERDLFVYVPPDYERSDLRYPTAYLLHAYGTTAEQLITPPTDGERWAPPLEDVLDPVFRRMGVPPMIVVIPDGWSRWGCGQWVDSPVTGNFEQYVLQDVVPYVDGAYRTLPSARSRGAFGFSSGGFGSWNLVSRNPDVFGAMGVLSADSWLDMTHKFMLYKYLDSIWPASRYLTEAGSSPHRSAATTVGRARERYPVALTTITSGRRPDRRAKSSSASAHCQPRLNRLVAGRRSQR